MRVIFLIGWLVTVMACGLDNNTPNAALDLDDTVKPVMPARVEALDESIKAHKLERFSSAEGFNEYIRRLQEKQEHQANAGSKGDCANCEAAAVPVAIAEAAPANGITNNQEAGVDEGGIVKAVGDYLVVLRRGRLFSIKAHKDAASLELVSAVDAFPPQHSAQTWYDELLIYENKVIVVGYSYGYGATEIGQFVMHEDGSITHQRTDFLRSNDYYSSRNYASRLVGSKLIFYMPFYFYNRYSDDQRITLPGQSTLLASGQKSEWRDIIETSSIIRPVEETLDPVLHTIAECDLGAEPLSCKATSVIGPYSRTFYVSPRSVYLWTSSQEGSAVYRLPIDGGMPGIALADGVPVDQFSFKESQDEHLYVMLREDGYGDAMWAPESRTGAVALLTLPLDQFSDEPKQVDVTNYASLDQVEGYQMRNRFVGNHILYGSDAQWGASATYEPLHIYDVKTAQSSLLDLGHNIERIEVMGTHAVVIGSQGNDLAFSAIELGDEPKVADTYQLKDKAQGEQRSHGFFYKPIDEHKGLLGLPIRSENAPWSELTESSASVFYLAVDNNHFKELGSLSSTSQTNVDDNCKASCVDWYGNSRPIFWQDRIFALLGYDLVLGTIVDNAIQEIQRLDFMPKRLYKMSPKHSYSSSPSNSSLSLTNPS